jgi:hypothetical protein
MDLARDLVGKGVQTTIPARQRTNLERARDTGRRTYPADVIVGGGSVTDNPNRFYTGCGATQSWASDDYAFGEAAVFAPGQFVEHHPVIGSRKGAPHFAGEHTSLKHSWIEGALESAVRVALEIDEDVR